MLWASIVAVGDLWGALDPFEQDYLVAVLSVVLSGGAMILLMSYVKADE